ncbi:unnamed protein product [Pedinophyceae sp. YPF-701]|nr:unnamed protein product [Pedinophyceae sp. YPF-701]
MQGSETDTKAKRYDRQVRVWGEQGQAALESARVCLLNASATGCEALKNLVLGGIKAFTILDGAAVTERDLGSNFMMHRAHLGRSRAACATELLRVLNDAVKAQYVEDHADRVIASKPEFFADFTLVIASNLTRTSALALDAICRPRGVSVIYARTCGLFGSVRLSFEEHRVLETRPEVPQADLRLDAPWPELQQHALSYDMEALEDIQHKHVPWACVLLQAAASWRAAHGGALPANREEQRAFKDGVKRMERVVGGVLLGEENIAEAVSKAQLVWAPRGGRPEDSAARVLEDPCATDLKRDAAAFWVMVAALRRFVQTSGGYLPLEGSIPDMTATTENYLALQRVYRAKAEQDVAEMAKLVAAVLFELGRDANEIPRDRIAHFCKHCRCMTVTRTPSLASELCVGDAPAPSSSLRERLRSDLSSGPEAAHAASVYVALRASDKFHAAYGHYPGALPPTNTATDEETSSLKQMCAAVLAEMGITGGVAVPDDVVVETVRFGAGEPHTVAALVGGIAAQEAIKVLTSQFVPVDGVVVYSGVTNTAAHIPL